MRKLLFPRHPLAPIVVPGRAQLDLCASAGAAHSAITEPGAAVRADLGPLPAEIEFQNLFWNKTLVSLEGMGQPTPETVWIRPYPLDYTTPPQIPKTRPRSFRENSGSTVPQIGNGISTKRQHESTPSTEPDTIHEPLGSRITIFPSRAPRIIESPPPMRMFPAQVEFQDAFWDQIQVPTANLDAGFIGRTASDSITIPCEK